jgi:hypothetical protein
LLTLQWLLTGAAVLAAVAALVRARRLAKRLDRLSEAYWQLRYEHGQLRARLNRLDPEQPGPGTETPRPAGTTAFVPLSSLKR